MSIALEIVQGTSRDFQFQLAGATALTEPWTLDPEQTVLIAGTPGSTASGSFLSTDVLTASVWAGSNEVPLLTPAASWISAVNAQIQVSLQNADSLSLAYGVYYLQAYATRAGTPPRTTALLPRGTSLEIIANPAATAPRPAYISITDIRKIAPWIDDLQVPDSHMGFDEQLADARDWLDEMTLRNYRGGNVSLLGYHGFALDAWYTGGGRRTSLTNRWLFAALASNQLLVTPRIRNVCSYYALSRICETMITKGGMYAMLAARFRLEAESLLASTTVEIDVNGDGFGEVPINFSSTNTLWA
ncbi:MAG: hypothetical protein ACLQU5_36985 [Isosphaeraceae bacterium]